MLLTILINDIILCKDKRAIECLLSNFIEEKGKCFLNSSLPEVGL